MAPHSGTLLPGKSHGWRSLAGFSPWGLEESDTLSNFTLTFHFHALEKEMPISVSGPCSGLGEWGMETAVQIEYQS